MHCDVQLWNSVISMQPEIGTDGWVGVRMASMKGASIYRKKVII